MAVAAPSPPPGGSSGPHGRVILPAWATALLSGISGGSDVRRAIAGSAISCGLMESIAHDRWLAPDLIFGANGEPTMLNLVKQVMRPSFFVVCILEEC